MKINIEEAELKKLQRAAAKLDALEAGGVDNWEWFGESLKEYRATIEREENLEDFLDELCTVLFEGAYEPSERGAGFTCADSAKAKAFKLLDSRIATLK